MSFKIYHDLEQGSPAWQKARCGVLTASEIGRLMTQKGMSLSKEARKLLFEKAAQRITGLVDVQKQTFAMERGHDDEAEARDIYRAQIAPVEEVGFMVRNFSGVKIGYSPDGLVGNDGLIECKSRCQKYQIDTITSLEVPAEHTAQIQAGLLVSGRDWLDYISFPACGGGKMMVLRVEPDRAYAERLLATTTEAEEEIKAITERYQEALSSGRARFFETERRDYEDPNKVEFL